MYRIVKTIQDCLDNEQEAAGRRLSCDTDSVNVRSHLSKVLILSILDFTIGFEIDHGPAVEVWGVLLKSKIDDALDEGAILSAVLKWCFTSRRDGSCRSLHERMFEGSANGCDGSINLPGGRVYEPSICFRYCPDLLGTRIKIHCGEHGMH